MEPHDRTEIVEDVDVFLSETLGFDKTENFELSDGFKSFPPIKLIKKGKKKKKGILRFDVKSKIEEVNEETEYNVSIFI